MIHDGKKIVIHDYQLFNDTFYRKYYIVISSNCVIVIHDIE